MHIILGLLFVSLVSCLSDFHSENSVSTITFGSCSKHDYPQPLWENVLAQSPDVWVWLGDAVYADIRIAPFFWMPSSLESMQEKFEHQKQIPGYKAMIDSKVPIIGTWDDHDYGIDGGGKSFKHRHQSQTLFLDFLDEPMNSVLRSRQGIYSSYTFGKDKRIVKIILLDVRSHHVKTSSCDVLGNEQWKWLEEQINDELPRMVFIGTGKQVLSDIPFIDKWMSCPSSLDKLIWMAQKRSRVMFLSGDVHFSEVNCLNSSGTGYPLYEVTSSGLTHSCSASLLPAGICDWTLKNVVASRYRVSNVITDKSFGVIKINWETQPIELKFQLVGEHGVQSQFVLSIDDLQIRRRPASCPVGVEQPNWYLKRVFWCCVVTSVLLIAIISLRIVFLLSRWVALRLLKDLDMNIKRRIKKVRLLLNSYTKKMTQKKFD